MACIPPNPRRVGYIVPIHGPLYMGSIYSNITIIFADTLQKKPLAEEEKVTAMATGCFKYKIAYLSLFGSRVEFLLLKGKTISFNFEKQLLHRSLIVTKPASCKTHCLVLSIRRVKPKSRDPKLCLDFKSMRKAIKSFVISHSIANARSKKKCTSLLQV